MALAAASPRPRPNPRVGALVLDAAGLVIGEGAHPGPGHPHAEVIALAAAGDRARGGTVVTTLEPCNHHGRTPPCTEAIAAAGITRVVVGAIDPDAKVAGAGVAALEAAGITVVSGMLADEVEAIDPAYFHHRRTGRPRITLKAAVTLDGQAAAADGTSQWITSPEARADGHRLRAEADAVVVGAGTVIADDPRLDARLDGYNGPQPQPVVIAGDRPLPADAAVFQRKALVYAPAPIELPAEVVSLGGAGGIDLPAMAADLADRGALEVLVEGGPTLGAALLAAGLVDRGVWYLGAGLAGGTGRPVLAGTWATLADWTAVRITDVRTVGTDVRVEFVREGR